MIARLSAVAVSFAALTVAQPSAQQNPSYVPSPVVAYTPAVGKCLPADQRKVNDTYNSLKRPTQPGDDMPFWDPEYFVGTWDVEMRTPESAFGSGGESVGTVTIQVNAANPCLYDGAWQAEDPEGKTFTRTITALYDPIKKTLTWTEKDSRGFIVVNQGPIGGELGGLFHHHFGDDNAGPATTLQGRQYRFKGVTEMSSPAYFKTDVQFSEAGQPFHPFGRLTYNKQLSATK